MSDEEVRALAEKLREGHTDLIRSPLQFWVDCFNKWDRPTAAVCAAFEDPEIRAMRSMARQAVYALLRSEFENMR